MAFPLSLLRRSDRDSRWHKPALGRVGRTSRPAVFHSVRSPGACRLRSPYSITSSAVARSVGLWAPKIRGAIISMAMKVRASCTSKECRRRGRPWRCVTCSASPASGPGDDVQVVSTVIAHRRPRQGRQKPKLTRSPQPLPRGSVPSSAAALRLPAVCLLRSVDQ